tara:strand:+ start:1536 stop:2567 length:1032 start_codon:yes stop_codon:yes gene_type:complete
MRIAVFGWYGHENAGDERLKYCLNFYLMSLGGVQKIDFYDLHENAIKGKTNQFDHYDLIIIGGGGLILSQANYHEFISGIQTKLAVLGVSVETELTGNPKKFAQALLEKSTIFLVRDQGSHEKLSALDINKKVKISSDLTFLEPYETTGKSEGNAIGINLLAKISSRSFIRSNPIANSILNRIGFPYNPKIISFREVVSKIQEKFDIKPIPFYCVKQNSNVVDCQKNDVNIMKKYFENVPASFNHRDIDKKKFFISMRLHGLIFSIQKGVIPITFSTYPKQMNLMRDMGLGELLVNIDDPISIMSHIDYALANEDIIKEKILEYNDNSRSLIKKDIQHLMNML